MSDQRSPRRQLLVLGLGLLVLAINVGLYRVRPRLKRLQQLAAEADQADEQRQATARAVQPTRARVLARQVGTLRATLRKREAALSAGRRRLTPREQSGEVAVQVAALAREVGLRVETEEAIPAPRLGVKRKVKGAPRPVKPGAPSGAALGALLQTEPFGRSLQTWTVSGDFAGLRQFLERLERLPFQVLVVRLAVERPDHLERYDPPLKITMTVSL